MKIEIAGDDAFIQIDILRFVTDKKWWGPGDCIDCNFYYRNGDIIFVSRNVCLGFDLLTDFNCNLKRLLKYKNFGCFLSPYDEVVSLNFTTNKHGLGYIIDFEFLYYYGRNLTCKGDMLVSKESLQKFSEEIDFLL